VVVDAGVNAQDLSQVAWQVLGNVDWSRDVVIDNGPVDDLDHASYQHSFGGKIGIDATAKWPEEGYTRNWPEAVSMDPAVKQKIDEIWYQLGIK
jgi:4-hydroxy-3-polyprenylbenzoate decarboxylase